MPRRRLRLTYSSGEEEEEEEDDQTQQHYYEPEPQLQDTTFTHPNPNPNPNDAPPVEISDDDFIDVSETFSPPSHPTPPPPPSATATQSSSGTQSRDTFDCLISEFLRRLGLRLRREWLDSCVEGLERSVPAFGSLDDAAKAKHCFEQFLFSDMNYSGGGVLPENVNSMHLVDLAGPFVLQVDEIVNISCPLKGRYQKAPSGIKRCLKLSMTDGVQQVFGMEYRPIKDLEVLAPAGLKVVICNVHIRHGLLMLVPEGFEVLGGLVEELDAARQRLVNEVNKPARGKRTRTGAVPSLSTRATLAAWPSNGVNVHGHTDSSTSPNAIPFQAVDRGATPAVSDTYTIQRTMEDFIPTSRSNAGLNPSSNVGSDVEEIQMNMVPNGRENAVPNLSSEVVTNVEETHTDIYSMNTQNAVANLSLDVFSDVENVLMVDEVQHPVILSGDREIPFTYLASLSAKWTAMKEKISSVQGIVKCFLTGVKGFQYKRRTTYELQVYVDDGSLISEILIDHNVVQKGIGHSPVEVTAALSSSEMEVVSHMKETMKQFQVFLVNFEGTMLVEINETSPLPVAVEMNQGCSTSDAWLLLRRLKSSAPVRTLARPGLDPIDVSP